MRADALNSRVFEQMDNEPRFGHRQSALQMVERISFQLTVTYPSKARSALLIVALAPCPLPFTSVHLSSMISRHVPAIDHSSLGRATAR